MPRPPDPAVGQSIAKSMLQSESNTSLPNDDKGFAKRQTRPDNRLHAILPGFDLWAHKQDLLLLSQGKLYPFSRAKRNPL